MAALTPGGGSRDNVMGDQYSLDIGVEPDLSGLIANLETANDLLDDADSKFGAIADTVATTTQRVKELTRATEQFVAQTAQIRNEYQAIASIPAPQDIVPQMPTNVPSYSVNPMAAGMSMGGGFGPMQQGSPGWIDQGASQAASNIGAPAPQKSGLAMSAIGINQARQFASEFANIWSKSNDRPGQRGGFLQSMRDNFETMFRISKGVPLGIGEQKNMARIFGTNEGRVALDSLLNNYRAAGPGRTTIASGFMPASEFGDIHPVLQKAASS